MTVSILAMTRHLPPRSGSPATLRARLGRPSGALRLHVTGAPFSVLCQNLALMVPPAPYLGTDRNGAIEAMIDHIRVTSPDVVGLCEVFADDERMAIYRSLKPWYPHYRGGPDEGDLDSDGGLALLSKHPILVSHAMIYTGAVGGDWFANKGVLHIRVQPDGSPTPYDVFFTHTQDLTATADAREALYGELSQLADFVARWADPDAPTLILGDLNVPAGDEAAYRELQQRLRGTVDLWRVSGGEETEGRTFVANNNFYADPGDNPRLDQRLDYVLLGSGTRQVPILDQMRVLRIERDGRFISDHFGLLARFSVEVEVE
ncbi:MAG: endonuclease/exonuclease/phosphatase family protein [Myxococcota bacterium]